MRLYLPFLCAIWHRVLLRVVPDGLEVKCLSCRAVHHIPRDRLEQAWQFLAEQQQNPESVEFKWLIP